MSTPSVRMERGAETGPGSGDDAISAVPLSSWWTLLVLLLMGLYKKYLNYHFGKNYFLV